MIERYIQTVGGVFQQTMMTSDNGDWIQYEDHIKAMRDFYDDLFHPEFGAEWQEPNGECYKAYWKGYNDAKSGVVDKKSATSCRMFAIDEPHTGWLTLEDIMSDNFKV